MEDREDRQVGDRAGRGTEESQSRTRLQSSSQALDFGPKTQSDLHLGCLTKQQLVIAVAAGLAVLLTVITVTAVLLTTNSGSSTHLPSFGTGGDMLDFLVQLGDISTPDGLLATWFHRANTKEEMNKALAGDAMILESDVTLEGYGTPNQKPIPIMAHPPDIYSDNTLDQWLEAVLATRKAMKLDFKSLESVSLSLELLRQKNSSQGINRPVWLNADILRGPNVPAFVPHINGSRFLLLIQERFPDVTVSPGWQVAYVPPLLTQTYTRSMVEDMYSLVQDVPQKVTFPVHALLVRRGWQHISWLLSQSARFSLTLWQGSIHPNVDDLLFVRDNSHPARVYYDIYEPTLSAFKQAAGQLGRLRRFYPGGDLMDFLYPTHSIPPCNSLAVRWWTVTDETSLLAQLSDANGGMLVVQVGPDTDQPGVPVVRDSGTRTGALTLENVLQQLGQRGDAPWGVYLRIPTQQLVEASLNLLQQAYCRQTLHRPVWVSMEGVRSTDSTQEFVSTVEQLFPYITLILPGVTWPPVIPEVVRSLSQRVAIHVNAVPEGVEVLSSLMGLLDTYDLIVDKDSSSTGALAAFKELVSQRAGRADTHLYVVSEQS